MNGQTETTFLGAHLQTLLFVENSGSAKPEPKSYTHKYPRTTTTMFRRLKAVKYLRWNYRVSMNKIAELIQVSRRTIHRDIWSFIRYGKKKYTSYHKYRSKNSFGIVNLKGEYLTWHTVKRLVISYMMGLYNSIKEALEGEPP